MALLVSCVWTAYKLIKRDGLTLWTPVPWFLGAIGAYLGIGPLVYTFGNPETISYLDGRWIVDSLDLWRTNLVNLVGVIVVISSFLLFAHFGPRFAIPMLKETDKISRAKSALKLFLFIGLPIQYLLVLPHELGLLGFLLPGSVYALKGLVLLGIMMLGYLSVSGSWKYTTGLILLCIIQFTVGLLEFNKINTLLVPIMAMLGRFLANRRITTIVLMAAIVVAIFAVLQPIALQGRGELSMRSHYGGQWSNLSQRLDVMRNVTPKYHATEHQGWWSRLCYTPEQAFVIHEYDSGNPGSSFAMAIYTFIPRFIWPEKPIISSLGTDFTYLTKGFRSSSTGIGIFAEAYWNGGWLAVILSSAYIGMLFAILSRLSLSFMLNSAWIFLPCIFLSIKMGFRVDGYFANDYVGAPVIYFSYLWILYFANKLQILKLLR
jgi:hypothetical protein